MPPSNYQVRRATVDDLIELRRLWQKAGFAAANLEKHLTEFQVVETADGVILGCVALQLAGTEGKLHSLALVNPELAPELHPRLWSRIESLARNHGLHRIWIADVDPSWTNHGFQPAGELPAQKLPRAFGSATDPWLVLPLRDDSASAVSLEKEFELFKQSQQKAWTDSSLRQAQVLKIFALLIASGVLFFLLWLVWLALTRLPLEPPPARRQPSAIVR